MNENPNKPPTLNENKNHRGPLMIGSSSVEMYYLLTINTKLIHYAKRPNSVPIKDNGIWSMGFSAFPSYPWQEWSVQDAEQPDQGVHRLKCGDALIPGPTWNISLLRTYRLWTQLLNLSHTYLNWLVCTHTSTPAKVQHTWKILKGLPEFNP